VAADRQLVTSSRDGSSEARSAEALARGVDTVAQGVNRRGSCRTRWTFNELPGPRGRDSRVMPGNTDNES
jgi:hypothetical protein